jgi:hypothetical protein
MSDLINKLRRGVQEYEPLHGVEIHAWNIGGADELMDEAADALEARDKTIADQQKDIDLLTNSLKALRIAHGKGSMTGKMITELFDIISQAQSKDKAE